MVSRRGNPRRQQNPTERNREDHQISRPEDRGRATLREESHGGTRSHRNARSDSQRSNKTSEHVAIPGDSRIQQKEIEKITKYQDLKIEVERGKPR